MARINSFLLEIRDGKIKNLSDEELETARQALIKILEQKDLKLTDEVNRYWNAICDDNGLYEFDRKQKKIAALQQTTKEQVQKLMHQLVFEDCRRMNIKLYSHAHWNEREERVLSEGSNRAFYKE